MWSLKHVSATNFVSFKDLDLELTQGVATLLYGINNDNENQKNNGTGKSSILEIIAFGITGESIKKVPNVNDIINNYEEEASVCLTFYNDFDGRYFKVERYISRSEPQRILLSDSTDGTGYKEIVLSSVAEYGKRVLDELGITKDDLYGCYLLNNARFKSFFTASDKEKKEIINNFSNGKVVDEAIELLQKDIEPLENKAKTASDELIRATSSLDAIDAQIKSALENRESKKIAHEKAVQEAKDKVAECRSAIQEYNKEVTEGEVRLTALDVAKKTIENLQKAEVNAMECYRQINDVFTVKNIPLIDNYEIKFIELESILASCAEEKKNLNSAIDKLRKSVSECESDYKSALKAYEDAKISTQKQTSKLDKDIAELNTCLDNLDIALDDLEDKIAKHKKGISIIDAEIDKLNLQIRGSITCPKCGFQFSVNGNETTPVDELADEVKAKSEERKALKAEVELLNGDIDTKEKYYDKYNQQIADMEKQVKTYKKDVDEAFETSNNLRKSLADVNADLDGYLRSYQHVEEQVQFAKRDMESMISHMLDQAYSNIDKSISATGHHISEVKDSITSCQAKIAVYQSTINATDFPDGGILKHLEETQAEYQKQLELAKINNDKAQGDLKVLTDQVDYFTRFKSYLANTKIDSIADLTNDFLQQIGSDMSVELSGYKVLKSKKVREKITVSILRDGEDGGAFEKFSAGERCRIVLAGILAMWKLTNDNCEDGKGLDLIILDEILAPSDYPGLMSCANAINDLGLTSILITQLELSESYPYRLKVCKSQGISTII